MRTYQVPIYQEDNNRDKKIRAFDFLRKNRDFKLIEVNIGLDDNLKNFDYVTIKYEPGKPFKTTEHYIEHAMQGETLDEVKERAFDWLYTQKNIWIEKIYQQPSRTYSTLDDIIIEYKQTQAIQASTISSCDKIQRNAINNRFHR